MNDIYKESSSYTFLIRDPSHWFFVIWWTWWEGCCQFKSVLWINQSLLLKKKKKIDWLLSARACLIPWPMVLFVYLHSVVTSFAVVWTVEMGKDSKRRIRMIMVVYSNQAKLLHVQHCFVLLQLMDFPFWGLQHWTFWVMGDRCCCLHPFPHIVR